MLFIHSYCLEICMQFIFITFSLTLPVILLLILIYLFKQSLCRSRMKQPKLTKENTLIKFKTMAKIKPDANVGTVSSNTKNGAIYRFNPRGQVMFPLEDYLIYRNGPETAQIDMRPLIAYPQYQHHLHTKTFNESNPFEENQQTQLIVNFMSFFSIPTQGIQVKITFIDGQISHDTQLIGKMSPYLKVKVNDSDRWRSKTVKKGDKLPNFNKEFVNLNLKNMNDVVSIEVWDEDMKNDDFVGQAMIKAYAFLGRGEQVIEEPITYTKKQKSIPAGKIRFTVQTPNLN